MIRQHFHPEDEMEDETEDEEGRCCIGLRLVGGNPAEVIAVFKSLPC